MGQVSKILFAALVVAGSGCIVDRGAQKDPDAYGADAPPPPPPPRAERKPPPPPPASPPAAAPAPTPTPELVAAPAAPATTVPEAQHNARVADAQVDSESAAHGRPSISNVDENGDPLPGTTGSSDDDMATGAPGANASADELARAWPGAQPVDAAPPAAGATDGNDDPAPPVGSASSGDDIPEAGTELDPATFEKPLRQYGRWVNTPDYGRVWIPYVANDWQPYSDGTWADTEYGWAFTSYDPWGWAVWHYGTWGFRGGIGWYWVPGRTWGPAWVSWRWGGGYAAWRPMAPWGVRGARWGNRGWVGVSSVHFTEPIRAGVILRGPSVGVAIVHTQPLPGPSMHPVVGVAYGPRAGAVARATGQPVVPVHATEAVRTAHVAARASYAQAGRAGAVQSNANARAAPAAAARPAQNVASGPTGQRPSNTARQNGAQRGNGNRRPGNQQRPRGGGGHPGGGKKHH